MGVCFSSKGPIVAQEIQNEQLQQYLPLFVLKQQLMDKMNFTDDHFFQVFLTFRFKNSIRKSSEIQHNIKQLRRKELGLYYNFNRTIFDEMANGNREQQLNFFASGGESIQLEKKMKRDGKKITQDDYNNNYIAKGLGPLPPSIPEIDLGLLDIYEHNILVTSWLNDLDFPQKEFEERILFYNNEKILNRGKNTNRKILHHFTKDNRSVFAERNVEFSCKKGQHNHQNQDSFFCVVDGDTKIFGIFDGHGVNGHQISAFASGTMLEFVKNSKLFKEIHDPTIDPVNQDQEITTAIRCCFKYTQDKVRDQYYEFLREQKKQKMAKERYEQREKAKIELEKKKKELEENYQFNHNSRTKTAAPRKPNNLSNPTKKLNLKVNDFDFDSPEQLQEKKRIEREISIQQEYEMIASDDVSIDTDDQDFIDNFSWDTSSEKDDVMIDHFQDDDILMQNYNFSMHTFKKRYRSENYQYMRERIEEYQANRKDLIGDDQDQDKKEKRSDTKIGDQSPERRRDGGASQSQIIQDSPTANQERKESQGQGHNQPVDKNQDNSDQKPDNLEFLKDESSEDSDKDPSDYDIYSYDYEYRELENYKKHMEEYESLKSIHLEKKAAEKMRKSKKKDRSRSADGEKEGSDGESNGFTNGILKQGNQTKVQPERQQRVSISIEDSSSPGPNYSLKKQRTSRSDPVAAYQERDYIQRISDRKPEENQMDILLSGTTATLVIQTPKKIYIGWVGDSLVALQGSEKNINQQFTKSQDLFMTYPPHKPDLQTEKVRIYSKRGEIRESPIDSKSRIYIRARMQPALNHTRTIGDLISHQIGVISEPDIKIHEILQNDKFFVMATNAVWEHLGPDEVIEIINEQGIKDYGTCSEQIFQKIKESAIGENQPIDDVTFIISHVN